MMSTADAREFRVEGHGASALVQRGGCRASWGYHREPLMTRRTAWDAARELMREGAYHTVKVIRSGHGEVLKVFRQADGTYIDAATCETIAT